MRNLTDIQKQAFSLREEKTQLGVKVSTANANMQSIESQIRSLKREGVKESDSRLIRLLQQQKILVESKIDLKNKLRLNHELLSTLRDKIKNEFNPEIDVQQLDDSYPILLFPLRLETRFKKIGSQNQLWVRVYPDDCNVVKHEPHLTEDELADAKVFWAEMAKAGKIEAEERGAWQVFAKSHGSNRASWIIEQYKPLNKINTKADESYKVLVLFDENDNPKDLTLETIEYWKEVWQAQGDESKIEIANTKLENALSPDEYTYYSNLSAYNITEDIDAASDKIIISKINLSHPDSIITTQTSWNEAPRADALPDKFVAITYSKGNKNTHVFEHGVRDNLSVSFDPSLEEGEIKKDLDGIQLNEELRWMVDFEEALKAGMATKINLSPQEAQTGFDQLFVLGIRISSNANTSKSELEDLINSHKFSNQGFGFIKQGTPTNNTEDNPSGYSWSENFNASFDRIFKGSENFVVSTNTKTQADAQRFADLLNLSTDLFQGLPNANGKDQLESIAMNTALFPATMGYFMEEMINPLFTDNDIENTRNFFSNYVSGRGPIPAIKIGRQPYGILPVARFSNLQFRKDKNFENKLKNLLARMDETWDSIVSQVNYIGKEGDSHQILLDVLGLHANSVEFHQRYAQSLDQVFNQLRLSIKNPIFAARIAAAIANRGKQILGELGLNSDLKLPILEKYFLSKPNKLSGPLVDDVPESEIDPIRAYTGDGSNYLEWLQSSDGNRIRLQNFDGNPSPNALLYLLLRHSILLSQANAGTNLLLNNKLIESRKVFHDAAFLHIQEKEAGKSKFEHLYQPNERITKNGSINLIQHIYKSEVLNHLDETKVLKEVLHALKTLEKTPTARLERLLIEHLDCCTYRIDAWKTGLTYSQLQQQKKETETRQNDKGIYLGAYGWLLDLRPKEGKLQEKKLTQEEAEFFASKGQRIIIDNSNLGYIHAPSVDQAATAAILRNAYDSNKNSGSKNPFAINLTSERVRIANNFLEGIRNGQSLSALLGYQFERGLHDRYQSTNIEADKFVYPLRMVFPLVTDHLNSTQTSASDVQEANETNNVTNTSIEAIEARNVIDGLKLIQYVHNSSTKIYPFGKSNLPSATNNERDAITQEVNRLIDINDAIVDLLMAEQVYQAVKGNFDRSAAVANAYSNGGYPPEMEVVNTPRSGLNLNHKVAIHFDAEADATVSPNSVGGMTPRAKAEASVNKWLSSILPNPEKVMVKVEVKEPSGVEKYIYVSQKDLGLQSIDLLFSATMDNEQAMTELDDRIINFLLYQYKDTSGNPLNQLTEITILYTQEIDSNDKSKVSFFELGTTLNSLIKILLNRPYVNHSSLQLPTEYAATNNVNYDIDELKGRIEKIKADLQAKQTDLNTFLIDIRSIQSLLNKNEDELKLGGMSENVIKNVNLDLSDSLKNYLLNPVSSSKDELALKYETHLDNNLISNPLKSTLLSNYNTYLDDYVADFANFPDLIENTCTKFMDIALYNNNLTGTGFIHQAIAGIYNRVTEQVKLVVERWEVKKTVYDSVMDDFDSATSDEEKIQILQKAERKISSQGTYPVPADIALYKTNVEAKNTIFNSILDELKNISTTNYADIIDFANKVNAIVVKIADHDVVSYDSKNNRNQLYDELKTLIQLKEDIYIVIQNLINHLTEKLKRYDEIISKNDTQTSDSESIELLLTGAKQLLAENILLVPQLKLSADFAIQLQLAHDNQEDIQEFSKLKENKLFPVEDWLSGVARIRENMWHFENTASLINGYKPTIDIDLKPLQFPIREDARWLAMKFIDETENSEEYIKSLSGDSLLYTAHFSSTFDSSKPIKGIVIDEWTEVVPMKNETIGIAFHYDQPNSEPPQTMLLVTPSQLKGKWEWEDITGAMEETLAMAKKRAVDPSMIDSTKFGQLLPTTLMAVSSHWITIAMNLSLNNLQFSTEQ